ncbi:hypothetical protein FB45DRAFT_870467 [Roridomyces roridus]|uniref:Uncharacterized protein n=1 Tax=Roridomyces roridus TaxID=1738132 RepID=A0AAD7FG87_9AGAR|nr:hypothetical protein FB45DRAFT_870467 [Roridomyces roridus]
MSSNSGLPGLSQFSFLAFYLTTYVFGCSCPRVLTLRVSWCQQIESTNPGLGLPCNSNGPQKARSDFKWSSLCLSRIQSVLFTEKPRSHFNSPLVLVVVLGFGVHWVFRVVLYTRDQLHYFSAYPSLRQRQRYQRSPYAAALHPVSGYFKEIIHIHGRLLDTNDISTPTGHLHPMKHILSSDHAPSPSLLHRTRDAQRTQRSARLFFGPACCNGRSQAIFVTSMPHRAQLLSCTLLVPHVGALSLGTVKYTNMFH